MRVTFAIHGNIKTKTCDYWRTKLSLQEIAQNGVDNRNVTQANKAIDRERAKKGAGDNVGAERLSKRMKVAAYADSLHC